MGTRSLTRVIQKWNDEVTNKTKSQTLVCMYRQMDGYPSGMGADLAEFLNEVDTKHNGAQCLAAQMVAHFKDGVGGIYLYPTNVKDVWQNYEYEIIEDENNNLQFKVIEVGYMNAKGKYCKGKRTLYLGTVKGFTNWLAVHEVD